MSITVHNFCCFYYRHPLHPFSELELSYGRCCLQIHIVSKCIPSSADQRLIYLHTTKNKQICERDFCCFPPPRCTPPKLLLNTRGWLGTMWEVAWGLQLRWMNWDREEVPGGGRQHADSPFQLQLPRNGRATMRGETITHFRLYHSVGSTGILETEYPLDQSYMHNYWALQAWKLTFTVETWHLENCAIQLHTSV